MSDAREAHAQAVAFAALEVQELQTLLGVAQEKAENAVGAVYQAVGAETGVESARNALENAGAVRDRIPELIAQLEISVQELYRYGGGF